MSFPAKTYVAASVGLAVLVAVAGCGAAGARSGSGAQTTIRVEGSDTLVNVAQAWAERYHMSQPGVSVQVLGGGSGVGIASLIDGNCDIANTSRSMKPDEMESVRAKRDVDAVETIAALDALAVLVHAENPRDSITIDELAEIFGDGGQTVKWSQLGVTNLPGGHDKIIRVGRQNSSGTYAFFREIVLGKKRDFKLGSIDAHGSKDAVLLIARTPGAIGYSGMGYITAGVKALAVSRRRGDPATEPTIENARNGTYPLTRPLELYTAGPPQGAIKEYIEWILSPKGQKIVLEQGYVPVRDHE